MSLLTVCLALLSATPTASPRLAVGRQVAAASADAPRVYAGIFLSDVSGFDLREGRFKADLDVWLKWSGSATPPVLRFVNGEIDSQDEQERESDGDWHSIRWRVQGTFRGTFPLHAFPFDRQELQIELALPEDTAHLLPDLGSSGMAQEFSITGWEYEPFFRAERGKEIIASDLGSIRNEGHSRTLESVKFVLDLNRPRTSNILKFMLPLAIILAMSFLGFALPHTQIDARGAIGVTALLSVVAFHFAMAGSLPDVPYLVAADRFFLASYVLVLLTVVETVVVFRLGDARAQLARRMDRGSAVALTVVALIVGSSVALIPIQAEARSLAQAQQASLPLTPAKPSLASAREELRVGVTTLPSTAAHGLGGLIRRGLTQPQADGELAPHLAEAIPSMTDESVRLLPDGGMLVRWRLKPNLQWSDGAPLTAKDLLFSLDLIDDPDRVEATAVDERTILVRYHRRLASALTDFILYPEHIARPLALDGGTDAIRKRNQSNPLPGDGPYRLVSFTEEKEALYERNPFFAGPPAPIARIRVTVMSPQALAQGLAEGSLDFVPVLPGGVVPTVQRSEKAEVVSALDESLLHLQPDLSMPAFQDPRVRTALLMALDRAAIADAYVDGRGRLANTFRPNEAPDHAADARHTRFDPDGARRLLAEAGAPAELKLTVQQQPEGSGYRNAVALIAQQLQAAGVALKVETVSSTQAFRLSADGKHGGLLLHSRRDGRPARFFNLPQQVGGVIDTRTVRPHFPERVAGLNQLFETSLFPERRVLLSRRLQREFAELLPVLPLAFGAQISGRSKALGGFTGAGQSGSLWWNVETWALTE